MNWIFWGLLICFGLFLIFIFGPAVVSYCTIFSRKKAIPLDEQDLTKNYFAPFIPQISDGLRRFDSISFSAVSTPSHDGITLAADYCPGTNGRTALFFHGYCSNGRNNFFSQAADLHRQGYALLLVHQRGHGRSGGAQTTFGLVERYDVGTWIDWLIGQDPDTRILLYGASMGAASIAYASGALHQSQLKAIVLDCGFICPFDMLVVECKKRSLPYRLLVPFIRLFMKLFHGLDICERNLDSLRNCRIPTLFFTGSTDETVCVADVQAAYDASAAEKEMLVVENAGHTLAYVAGGQRTRAQLSAFADRYFT